MSDIERTTTRVPEPTMPSWEYAPAPESKEIVRLRDRYELFVDGRSIEPKTGRYFETIDPATEEPRWRDLPGKERAKYLYRISRALQERSREFAVLETLNNGKPIKESRDIDVPLAAAHFFYYAGWADKLDYAFPGRVPRPLGVAAQILPRNFPLLMLAWKIAPALACGNTVVLKPAHTTPLSALFFCDVVRQAGMPPRGGNILTGDGHTGATIVRHEGGGK